MRDLRDYLLLARSTTSKEFVTQGCPLYLVKRPVVRPARLSTPSAVSFETKHTKFDADPYVAEWRVAPIKKREGNPYPDEFVDASRPYQTLRSEMSARQGPCASLATPWLRTRPTRVQT